MQLAEPAAVTSARARPVLEVKDLRTYFPMEMAPVPAVNGVILTVGEDEGYILDRVDHPRGRRECLVSAATCMSWLGTRDSVPRASVKLNSFACPSARCGKTKPDRLGLPAQRRPPARGESRNRRECHRP